MVKVAVTPSFSLKGQRSNSPNVKNLMKNQSSNVVVITPKSSTRAHKLYSSVIKARSQGRT